MPHLSIEVNRLPMADQGGMIDVLRQITDPSKPRASVESDRQSVGHGAARRSQRRAVMRPLWSAPPLAPRCATAVRLCAEEGPTEPTFCRVRRSANSAEINEKTNRCYAMTAHRNHWLICSLREIENKQRG